jgi:hypothetical protein
LVGWSTDGDRFAFVSRAIVRDRNGAFQGVERLQVADSLTGKRATWRGVPFSFTRKLGFQGNVTANRRNSADRSSTACTSLTFQPPSATGRRHA